MVVSFLSTDPLYRRRFASVEPFADWAARDATRGTSQDRGVDKAKAELAKANEARTKLVMACGSGKTYTSLILAEEIAGLGKRVLYAVPSIALLGQTMRSWAEEEDREVRGIKHSYIGVCSDPKTGKRGGDGTDASDLAQMEFAVTTDPDKIHEAICRSVPRFRRPLGRHRGKEARQEDRFAKSACHRCGPCRRQHGSQPAGRLSPLAGQRPSERRVGNRRWPR